MRRGDPRQRPGAPPAGEGLTLIVRLDPGERLAGTMSGDPGTPELAFDGWVSFIEALESLRRGAGGGARRMPG